MLARLANRFAGAQGRVRISDDDIRSAGHVKRALKKYGVADLEFVDGNDGTSLDEIQHNAANALMPAP